MRLVSDQPDEEIQRRKAEQDKLRALDQLQGHLRRLAANIMRVTRGAGASYDLGDQMAECLIAMRDYQDLAGCGVSSYDLSRMLDLAVARREREREVDEETAQRWEETGKLDVERAETDIHRASLQISAAILLDQPLQLSRGESDFASALRYWEESVERRRAYYQSQLKAEQKLATKPKRLKKKISDII